jgi:hypothetical protein
MYLLSEPSSYLRMKPLRLLMLSVTPFGMLWTADIPSHRLVRLVVCLFVSSLALGQPLAYKGFLLSVPLSSPFSLSFLCLVFLILRCVYKRGSCWNLWHNPVQSIEWHPVPRIELFYCAYCVSNYFYAACNEHCLLKGCPPLLSLNY